MPIYSYECDQCEWEGTILCKYEEVEQPCPECGEKAIRQLSAPKGYVKRSVYDEFL